MGEVGLTTWKPCLLSYPSGILFTFTSSFPFIFYSNPHPIIQFLLLFNGYSLFQSSFPIPILISHSNPHFPFQSSFPIPILIPHFNPHFPFQSSFPIPILISHSNPHFPFQPHSPFQISFPIPKLIPHSSPYFPFQSSFPIPRVWRVHFDLQFITPTCASDHKMDTIERRTCAKFQITSTIKSKDIKIPYGPVGYKSFLKGSSQTLPCFRVHLGTIN